MLLVILAHMSDNMQNIAKNSSVHRFPSLVHAMYGGSSNQLQEGGVSDRSLVGVKINISELITGHLTGMALGGQLGCQKSRL